MYYSPKGQVSIRQAVLENAASPAPRTPAELAADLGVELDSVYEATSRLRGQGKLRPSERQVLGAVLTRQRAASPPQPIYGGSDAVTLDPKALLEDIEREVVLSDLDRRRILSRLARTAPGPVKVQALKVLEDMDRQHGRQVGPPPPSTDAEQAERAATVLASVGSEVGGVAIQKAIEVWKREEGIAVWSHTAPSEG
jgi:hypothetical protein